MKGIDKYLEQLEVELRPFGITSSIDGVKLNFNAGDKKIACVLVVENYDYFRLKADSFIPLDYLVTQPKKVAAQIVTKLKLNETIFARNCTLQKISKKEAEEFSEQYHLMGFANCAYCYGLFHRAELIALATFSKGRKMNRLRENERSYEMIRFCCKKGITVTGGLSKLVNHFVADKEAGDIMTYVNAQWGDGSSFLKAGFIKHSQQESIVFLISKQSFKRTLVKEESPIFNPDEFYVFKSPGNIKLVYTPPEK